MPSNRPDPGEFFDMAQRMLRELFGDAGRDDDPWAAATRRAAGGSRHQGERELSPERQRENLTFALATRAVEALEDVALNVAAIRQRLERTEPRAADARPESDGRGAEEADSPTT